MNSYNNFFLVLFSFLFLIGFSYAVDVHISECTDLNSTHYGNTIILDNNIDTFQADGNCFKLAGNPESNTLNINCNNYAINIPLGEVTKIFNTATYYISEVTFSNCYFNGTNYTLNSQGFYIDRDINKLSILDSNILVTGGNFIYITNHPSLYEYALDVNFYGSQINMSNTSMFAAITRGFSSYLKFHNLNVDSTSNQAMITFTNTDVVLSLSIIGSDINLSNSPFILDLSSTDAISTYYFTDTLYSGVNAFNKGQNIDKNINTMFFSNFDANYIYFDTVNVIPSSSYIKLLSGTDLNYIEFSSNSDVHNNAGVSSSKLLEISGVTDSYLNVNFNDASIDMYGTDLIKISGESNIAQLDLYNLSSIIRRGSLIYLAALYDLNLNLIDSNIILSDYSATGRGIISLGTIQEGVYDSNFDFNFNNSIFSLPATAGFLYSNFDTYVSSIDISNLNLSVDTNLLDINGITIPILNIFDSNINVDRIANLTNDANVTTGTIYNNIIYYDGTSNLVEGVGTFNVDFNTSYNSNNLVSRQLWLVDDTSVTGGNLWLNIDGNNLCTPDSLNPYGICDSNFTSADGYIDYLPLVEYTHSIDAAIQNITLMGSLIYGDSINFQVTTQNQGDENIEVVDMNVIVYYASSDTNTGTTITTQAPGEVIEPAIIQYIVTDYWNINTIDFNYICARVESSFDINLENDYYCESFDVNYRDINANNVSVSDSLIYDTDVNLISVIDNIGDYNTNDVSLTLLIYEDANIDNNISFSLADQNIVANSSNTIYQLWDINIIGTIDYNLIATGTNDYNLLNNYVAGTLGIGTYVDLNVNISIPDVNAGHSADVNCTVYNIGTANASDYNVYLYVNDVLTDSNTSLTSLNSSSNEIVTLSWTPTAMEYDLNLGCVVSYSLTDYNSLNNSRYLLKSVGSDTNVDLSPTNIVVNPTTAGTSTITCDINNLSVDENATNDYNVLLYIDDSLIDFELVESDLLTEDENTFSFTHTFTAGTYDVNCLVDYNVLNYSGFDANILNNSYSESVTITSVTVNSPGGGGGGGSSDKTEITKDIILDANKGSASFSNSDNDGVDKVIINYNEDITGSLTLILNTEPELTASNFKVIYDNTVINYLQFTYSGDQTKLEKVTIIFSLPKSEVKDKSIIRLGRLNNGVWVYYVPSNIDDKGTYYQFSVNVPGFSYFAIVSFKELVEKDTNLIVNKTNDENTIIKDTTIKTNTNSNINKDNNYSEDDYNNYSITPGTGAKRDLTGIYWVLGVIVVLGIIFGLYLYLRNKPKNPGFSFNDNINPNTQKPSL